MVVDDELEAATRFNGSEEDDDNEAEEDKSRIDPMSAAEIWRKSDHDQQHHQNAVMLKDMTL